MPLTSNALAARTNGGQKALCILPVSEDLQVSGHSDGLAETVCKTVGSAYVGSNPTTTSRNAPDLRIRGQGAFVTDAKLCG